MRTISNPRVVTGSTNAASNAAGPGWSVQRAGTGLYDLYVTAGRYVALGGVSANIAVVVSNNGPKPATTPIRLAAVSLASAATDCFISFSAMAYD